MSRIPNEEVLRKAAQPLLDYYEACNRKGPGYSGLGPRLLAELKRLDDPAVRMPYLAALLTACCRSDWFPFPQVNDEFVRAAWPLVTTLVLADSEEWLWQVVGSGIGVFADDVGQARARVRGAGVDLVSHRRATDMRLPDNVAEAKFIRAETVKAVVTTLLYGAWNTTAVTLDEEDGPTRVGAPVRSYAVVAEDLAKAKAEIERLRRVVADGAQKLAATEAELAQAREQDVAARRMLAAAARRTETVEKAGDGVAVGGLAVDVAVEVLLAHLDDERAVNMAHFAIRKDGADRALVTVQRPTGKSAVECLAEAQGTVALLRKRIDDMRAAMRSVVTDSHDGLAVDLLQHKLRVDDDRETPVKSYFDREKYGQLVRAVWVRWARTDKNPKPSWLTPWEHLPEHFKEVDRMIGEACARVGASGLGEPSALPPTLAEMDAVFSTLRDVQGPCSAALLRQLLKNNCRGSLNRWEEVITDMVASGKLVSHGEFRLLRRADHPGA